MTSTPSWTSSRGSWPTSSTSHATASRSGSRKTCGSTSSSLTPSTARAGGRPRSRSRPTLDESVVHGSRERLHRAVSNLLDNAVKWSPDGGTVEVRVADAAVSVRDHGPGIAEEDLPKVFDRFYRAPSARGLPGSGLGLAIVRQVAESHGGRVSAARADGGGTVVTLQLIESS